MTFQCSDALSTGWWTVVQLDHIIRWSSCKQRTIRMGSDCVNSGRMSLQRSDTFSTGSAPALDRAITWTRDDNACIDGERNHIIRMPFQTARQVLESRFHTRMEWSQEPEYKIDPSSLITSERTVPMCPFNVASNFPLDAFHNLINLSPVPDTSYLEWRQSRRCMKNVQQVWFDLLQLGRSIPRRFYPHQLRPWNIHSEKTPDNTHMICVFRPSSFDPHARVYSNAFLTKLHFTK